MDRVTKLIVVGWACAAIAVETWLTPGWRELGVLTAGVFAAAAILTAFESRGVALVLALTYVFPALIRIVYGRYHVAYDVVWMSALLGAITPDAVRTRWHLPAPWRAALVCWALIIAAGAVIVACREVNFSWRLFAEARMPTESLGGVPRFTAGWVLHVALILVLGILWFDWLFSAANHDFRRWVIAPLAASCLVLVAVAIYQLFGDIRFFNETVYASLGRATGTVFDANVCGTIAAVWIGGAALYSYSPTISSPWRGVVLIGGITAGWLAVWASGSRTAFAAAVIVTAFVVLDVLGERSAFPTRPAMSRRLLLAVGLPLGAILLAVMTSASVGGPVKRIQLMVESAGSLTAVLAELWNRNEYGRHAVEMIADYPLFGVGVGGFHLLVNNYARMYGGPVVADNAQNWYRHQLAEFGIIGSLGWIAWLVIFGLFVLKRRDPDPTRAGERTARGILVAFAIISLVGMPSQHVTAAITFWTMAFWFVSLSGARLPATPLRRRTWALVLIVCVVYVAGAIRLAATDLRVPARAQRAGQPYSYGFYLPEPDGAGGEQRWARDRAAIVLDRTAPWMALTIASNHFDIATRPVRAKVWVDGRLIVDTVLDSPRPMTKHLRIPDGHSRVLLEISVSRTLRPRDFGVEDDRELGLLVKWHFVDVVDRSAQ